MELKLKVTRKLFSFNSKENWINNAKNLYAECGVPYPNYITIDYIGRICTHGAHFSRAKREKTYPISVYEI